MGFTHKTMIKKQKIQQIVNCFETGKLNGDYGQISIFNDGKNGAKQLTYGRSQCTSEGALLILLKRYSANENGQFSKDISYCLSWSKTDSRWATDKKLHNLLQKAGDDPVMREVQDQFFDDIYFNPAMKWAETNGFSSNLARLVIYDSFIHSGGILDFLRKRFAAATPKNGGSEEEWITQYVNVRHAWLVNHSNKILRNTVCRTNDMKRAISAKDWNLDLTFSANGIKVP